jgi:hypothetical protein
VSERERTIKWGASVALATRFDGVVERRRGRAIGYAVRRLDGPRVRFAAGTGPVDLAGFPPEGDGPAVPPLPGTWGSFAPPEGCALPSPALLEETARGLANALRDRSRGRVKLAAALLEAGAAWHRLENSAGARVEWGASLFSAGLHLETPGGPLDLPLARRGLHGFRPEECLEALEPYFHLPLPEEPAPAGRFPAAWFPFVGAFVAARLGRRLLEGAAPPRLPPGFALADDPIHPQGLAWAPVDGEGRRTRLWRAGETPPADTVTARRLGTPATGHAVRVSIFHPPCTGFHNLHFTGPDTRPAGADDGLCLTLPLRMDWHGGGKFTLFAQAFRFRGGVPETFLPCVRVRSSVGDCLASLAGCRPPVHFFPLEGSAGAPLLFFKGLNFVPW